MAMNTALKYAQTVRRVFVLMMSHCCIGNKEAYSTPPLGTSCTTE